MFNTAFKKSPKVENRVFRKKKSKKLNLQTYLLQNDKQNFVAQNCAPKHMKWEFKLLLQIVVIVKILPTHAIET